MSYRWFCPPVSAFNFNSDAIVSWLSDSQMSSHFHCPRSCQIQEILKMPEELFINIHPQPEPQAVPPSHVEWKAIWRRSKVRKWIRTRRIREGEKSKQRSRCLWRGFSKHKRCRRGGRSWRREPLRSASCWACCSLSSWWRSTWPPVLSLRSTCLPHFSASSSSRYGPNFRRNLVFWIRRSLARSTLWFRLALSLLPASPSAVYYTPPTFFIIFYFFKIALF